MFTLSHERPHDAAAIDDLLDRAFGPQRFAKTSYRYREGVDPLAYLGLVALREERLVGTIRYWPVVVGGGQEAAGRGVAGQELENVARVVLLGPLATDPDLRGSGIGMSLMGRSLRLAAAAGHGVAILVGDLDYYARAGFVPAAPFGLVMPGENPDRLLVRGLRSGALAETSGAVGSWAFRRHPRPPGIDAMLAALSAPGQ